MSLNSNKLAEIKAKLEAARIAAAPIENNLGLPFAATATHQTISFANQVPLTKPTAVSGSLDALIKSMRPGDSLVLDESTKLPEPKAPAEFTATDRFGKTIQYNEKQLSFVRTATSGIDAILIGAAGTGKTTCMKGVVQELILSGAAGVISEDTVHKHILPGTPGIIVCAYTRRAVNNIRKNMPDDMKDNCITIHKLLEYEPVFYEVDDPVTGKTKKKMEFRPARNSMNPLPESIHTIIFEESSMIGTSLYHEVANALCHPHQELFLGDIQQLPPVFGPAILGFKLQSLQTVELTEVYRQALESPIIRLAHRILNGTQTGPKELKEISDQGAPHLTIKPWSKTITPEAAMHVLGNTMDSSNLGLFPKLIQNNGYDPQEDMVLIPQNVNLGTDELNKHIAQFIARREDREVWEVIAGFDKHYFTVGEKVMFERNDGVITKIEPNPLYGGTKITRKPSKTLTYWGMETAAAKPKSMDEEEFDAVDFMLGQASLQDEDRVHAASHIITIKLADVDKEVKIDKAAQINATILGYALTVHKAQGSEWRRVFLVFHQSHNRMLQRELLYTAVTRAREELVIICERDSFEKGIESQRIKGNTLKEKAIYFKGKYSTEDEQEVMGIQSHSLK